MLIGAFVDFVFVAIMYAVEKGKILLFIYDAEMFFLDFFLFSLKCRKLLSRLYCHKKNETSI